MSLSPGQQQIARLIVGLAAPAFQRAGIQNPSQRAQELAAAAYAESGLNPNATNTSSGAAGLFQLLSPGYRQRAQTLGGLYSPEANTQAILPSYVNYFRSNPNAAPGEAGRDVERSGEGASFYSSPLGLLGGVAGADARPSILTGRPDLPTGGAPQFPFTPTPSPSPTPPPPVPRLAPQPTPSPSVDPRLALALAGAIGQLAPGLSPLASLLARRLGTT